MLAEDPLAFIKECIRAGRIYWTYHVNMRFAERPITRDAILGAVSTFEVIEEYPEDKYLPSYLVRAVHDERVFHLVVATDVKQRNVRVVTAYVPDEREWDNSLRTRRSST